MYRSLLAAALAGIIAHPGIAGAEVATTEITQSSQRQAPIRFVLRASPNETRGFTSFKLTVPDGQTELSGWDRTVLQVLDGERILLHAKLQPTVDEVGQATIIEFLLVNELIQGGVLSLVTPIGESESSQWYNIQLATYVQSEQVILENGTAVDAMPAGRWRVDFANGVVEKCEVYDDGTVRVEEPHRTSAGLVTIAVGQFVLTFGDYRVERWTPIGEMMLVEHWYPADGFPHAAPVYGIARLQKLSAPAGANKSVAALEKDNEELRSKLEIAEAQHLRAELRLLTYLSAYLEGPDFEPSTAREAKELAMRLAPRVKGSRTVWRVLIKTEVLRDGISLAEAEALLGPATSQAEQRVDWYYNPSHRRHVAPFLGAKINEDGKLADWVTGNR